MSRDKDKTGQNHYTWKNKQQYSHRGIKESTEKLLTYQSQEKEAQLVADLFEKMNKSSVANLIHIDEQTKQLSLHSVPKYMKTVDWSPEKIQYMRAYDDIRNRFTYLASLGHNFGGRGTFGLVGAVAARNNSIYSLTYNKILWERLDNLYTSNTDKVDLRCSWADVLYLDWIEVGVGRESRQNEVNPYDKNQTQTKIFGLTGPQSEITKHSNLFFLMYQFKKAPFSVFGKIGLDISNESIFKQLYLKFEQYVYRRDNIDIQVSLQAGNMWGRNILKNDMLFRNYSTWPGNRSKNMVSPRAQIYLKQYPFLSSFNLHPYMYTQLWSTFNKNQLGRYDTKIQGEYGIGMFSKQSSIKCQIGLFRFSAQRKVDVFGSFKFSF